MKKNCRNCRWAAWQKSSNGRRLFGNYAPCTYVVTAPIPLSRSDAARNLNRIVSVVSYEDIEMNCPTWEKANKP